jgi:hypothetical protein
MAVSTPVFRLIAGDVLVRFFDPSSSGELGSGFDACGGAHLVAATGRGC